ncbi:cell division protein FtsX [Pseudomonadota bacterium]
MRRPKLKAKDITGNIFVSLGRGLKLGLSNFWRNRVLSIATILVIAIILFIFNIILAIQFISNQALTAISERVDIVIYLNDDTQFYEVSTLIDDLEKIIGVKTVKYTSKEEALEIVSKTHPKTASFLKKFNLRNPLPPSISIITERAEDHLAIQNLLQEGEHKKLLQNVVTEGATGESVILSNVAENLFNISTFVKQIIFWMVLVFVLGGTLVIVNAIQLTIYTRRKEIGIMRLVGSTLNFIRLPFIFEGMLYGFFAVLLSFLILLILSNTIQIEDSNLLAYMGEIEITKLFIFELLITLVLAVICSFSAVQRYVKGKLTMN